MPCPNSNSRHVPCTIFAVSETLGKAANWEDIGETHGNEKIMTFDQVRKVSSALVGFGAHTMTHPVLTTLDEQAAKKEIVESRSRLQELLGRQISLFSFPYGAFNNRLICLCREAGYQRVFTTIPAPVRGHEFVVGRTPVEPTDSQTRIPPQIVRRLPMGRLCVFAKSKGNEPCRGMGVFLDGRWLSRG